jgi:Secretion system C-terminal sorting domain
MKTLYTFFLLLTGFTAYSQTCPELSTVLINSCPTGETSANEWFTFKTGSNALPVNNFTFQYGTPPAFTTFQLLAGTAAYVAQPVTVTLSGCATINVVLSGGTIPANSNVIVIPNTTTLTTFNLSGVCSGGVAYVLFYNPATSTGNNLAGNFANAPATARGFRLTNTTAPCSGSFTPASYQYTNSWPGNTDGNGVNFNAPNTPLAPSYNNAGCIGGTTLPVILSSFTAGYANNTVTLKWQTETEINSSHFEIERSYNGIDFEVTGKVTAAGNTNSAQQYSFTEKKPKKTTAYYRLKMIDTDARFVFSNVSKINMKETGFAINNIYPQPATDHLTVEWNSSSATAAQIIISDAAGRKIRSVNLQSNSGFNQYQINTSAMAPGQYFVSITCGSETIVEKLMKQ